MPSRTAHSIGEALAAGDELGYPVVLKTFGALHKSDVGGVALDLADDAALSLAYTAMAQSLGPAATVQPMVADGVEVSVGFVRDEAFGPLLVVAAGGTLVELLADRWWRVRPCRMRARWLCSTVCAFALCWRAGAVRRRSTSTRWRT